MFLLGSTPLLESELNVRSDRNGVIVTKERNRDRKKEKGRGKGKSQKIQNKGRTRRKL